MAQFTDWFLADAEEATELADALRDELAEAWPRISLREVNEPELVHLSKILLGGAFSYESEVLFPADDETHGIPDDVEVEEEDDAVSGEDDYPRLDEDARDGGTFVKLVPEEFIHALAAIDDGDLGELATRWRTRSERLRGCSADDLGAVLESMREFAVMAAETNKAVLSAFEI